MSESGVRIGEAAALYDLAPSTLRWWERQGVLTGPARSGDRRLYRERDLRRLGLVYLCRVTGMMPLDRVAVVTSKRTTNLEVWRGALSEQIDFLEERIARMRDARDYLTALLRCEHDDPARCPSLDIELTRRTPRGRVRHHSLVAAARAAGTGAGRPAAEPARDEKKPAEKVGDESPPCPGCGHAVPRATRLGRPRTYCSATCRQRAYRRRALPPDA
ncbi:MerR family transcriptional regulator [Spirillospora sp. CA-294931]|uniref:helix-turn-helix domain-containing protein n=1 Tax=Spirillospora sp. CA-294931 TaxID=3240042 RepID=UPI003D8A3222